MQLESNILLVAKKTVSRMPFEVVPDLLNRVEFRSITGKTFEVKPGERMADRIDRRPLVDPASVPDQDNLST